MTPEQFFTSTPAQLVALADLYNERREEREFGPALIVTAISQAMGGKTTPEDFMPSAIMRKRLHKEQYERERMLRMRDFAIELAAIVGGEITRNG